MASANMTQPLSRKHSDKPRVVGIRMSDDVANSFKAEAAQRGMSVTGLFHEMWDSYRASAAAQR